MWSNKFKQILSRKSYCTKKEYVFTNFDTCMNAHIFNVT